MNEERYKEAVEAYKNALRNDPTDDETRYNLALAKKLLEDQQQEGGDDGDDKNKEDQNKDDQNNKENQDEHQLETSLRPERRPAARTEGTCPCRNRNASHGGLPVVEI